jgi:YVTN family beta-propeller protein
VYTVTVTGGVQDPKGNFLSPTFTSKFTTGQSDLTAPTVTQVIPVDNATGMLATAPIYVSFSKRMDATTISSSLSVYESVSKALVNGIVTVTQDNTVAMFTPSSTLIDGQTYKVSVSTVATDASGKPLAAAFESSFTVVSGHPAIVTIGPANGASGISVSSPVYVDFSKSIDPATVNSKSISLTVDGSLVGGTFEFLKDNSRVIFRPSVPLQFSKTYQVAITTDIKDLLHNSLTTGQTTTFQTADLLQTPVITAMDPPAAPPGTTVVIAGKGFDPNPAMNDVKFGAIIVGASSSSETEITTVVPDGAYAGFVEVKVAKQGKQSGAYLFDVLIPLLSTQDNIIAGASTESQPTNADISPDGALALVTNFASNTVSVIGLKFAQPTIGTPIPVGKNPFDVAITPDGSRAYVTNYGSNSVSVIDLATNTVISTIGVGMNPMGIAVTITPDGDRICVANSGSNSLSVIDGDPYSGAFNQIIAGASTESSPKDVEVSPDGTLAFVTGGKSLLIIDINRRSASYDHIIGQASTTSETKDVDVTPDGAIAIVTTKDGSILMVDVFPKSPGFGGIIAGASTTSGADQPEVSPDGMRVYVTSRASNTLLVYDILYAPGVLPGTVSGIATTGITLKLNHTVNVGTSPLGIAIDPHYQKIVVVNSGANTVSILSPAKAEEAAVETIGMLVTRVQALIDKPTTSKDAANHLGKAQKALRDATDLMSKQNMDQVYDRFKEAIHELKLAASSTLIVSDIIGSIVQVADKIAQDALKDAKVYAGSTQVDKFIADASQDIQTARGYIARGDPENAMTSYKNSWTKSQLAIKQGQKNKSSGGKPQDQDQDFSTGPTELSLGQNYPNPFNSTTQIVFDIPVGETGGLFVELKVYNILGQLVRTLVNEVKAPGRYVVSWNGKHDDGRPTASGMYLVRFKAGNFQQTRRVVLIQ